MIIRFVLAFKPPAKVKRCHECFIKNNMFFVSFDIINKNLKNTYNFTFLKFTHSGFNYKN